MAKKNNKKELKVEKKCAICSNEITITCSNCNKVKYCSKEHQKQDWDHHKNVCKPFEIAVNDIFGRYLVASKDIKQGEVILKESPILVGPSISSIPLCLKCYKPIPPPVKHQVLCLKCGVAPLCSLHCNSNGHSNIECEYFKSNPNITWETIVQHCQIILPLRCLLLRQYNIEKWEEFIKMESHLNKRRDTPIWRNHKMNVEDVINKFGTITAKDKNEELLQKICGILDVNTFEVRVSGLEMNTNPSMVCLRGVFLQAAMMAHDCIGNTHLAVDDNFNMTVHASLPIKKGTPIYFNYTNTLHGTFDRQEHLKEGKYFNCTCKRCLDSTECGTHMSSLMCVKCKKGYVTPVKTVNNVYTLQTIWKCSDTTCTYECRGIMVGTVVSTAKNLIEDEDITDVCKVEKLIKKLLNTFSPGHSIILDLKQNLVGHYTQLLREEVNVNKKYLRRKLELCQELIPILEKVEPGVSRLRGITLYEMHIPMVIIANRAYDNGEIAAEELLKNVVQAEEVLKTAISYLLYEPLASPEGRLGANAMNELKLLRKSILNIEQIVENKKLNVDKRRRKKK